MRVNLMQDTLDCLMKEGKALSDVIWVGTSTGQTIAKEDFIKIASNLEFDDGFGGNEIRSDLVVVGDNWWMERGEYDGSEWWEFKSIPKIKLGGEPITELREVW